MILTIWTNGGWNNIQPNHPVKTFKRLTSFCAANCLRNAIIKTQGGYYLIGLDGTLTRIERTLQELTFETVYKLCA